MPLISQSWVQITASSVKFIRGFHGTEKAKIQRNNADKCLLWMVRFILGTKNIWV